jgi:Alpha/beta hydrolase domain
MACTFSSRRRAFSRSWRRAPDRNRAATGTPTFTDPDFPGVNDGPLAIGEIIAKIEGRGEVPPKMLLVSSTTDYYSLRASLGRTGASGTMDQPLPADVRMYDIAGGSHVRVANAPSCKLPPGHLDWTPVSRALLVRLDAWVSRNAEPPRGGKNDRPRLMAFVAAVGCSRDAARVAAEKQLALLRVQEVRIGTINRRMDRQSADKAYMAQGEQKIPAAIADAMTELLSFERYQRRALSDCKNALLAMQATSPDVRRDAQLALDGERYLRRLLYLLDDKKVERSKWMQRYRRVITNITRLACKYIFADKAVAGIEYLDSILRAEPDQLLLQAVRACALLITNDPTGRELALHYRGRSLDGERWEEMILIQLRRLRRAPRMQSHLIKEVAALLNCEPTQRKVDHRVQR